MWEPILINSNLAQKAEVKMSEIVKCIDDKAFNTEAVGISYGKAGHALFYAYLQQYLPSLNAYEKMEPLLIDAFSVANTGFDNTYFASGISGILWTLKHLSDNKFIEFDEDMAILLESISISLEYSSITGYLDYMGGALGVAKTILQYKNNNAESCIKKMIVELEKHSKENEKYMFWESVIYNEEGLQEMVCNLGLAHGIPSIIVMLCDIKREYPHLEFERIDKMLQMSCNFLLSCKNEKVESINNQFPGYVKKNGIKKNGDRMGWCYGDVGVSIALLRAGIALNNKNLIETSISIALKATYRTFESNIGIRDTCFCHGSLGLAHLFNRWYQYTKKTEFKSAALYWVDLALRQDKFSDGYAGYKTYDAMSGKFINDLSLLEGITGSGLVLMSMLKPIEPKWDEIFLLSHYQRNQNVHLEHFVNNDN